MPDEDHLLGEKSPLRRIRISGLRGGNGISRKMVLVCSDRGSSILICAKNGGIPRENSEQRRGMGPDQGIPSAGHSSGWGAVQSGSRGSSGSGLRRSRQGQTTISGGEWARFAHL